MKFINRESTNPNRKVLNVVSITYDSSTGNPSTICVDETRSEGAITTEGTKLNAQNLNSIFEDLSRGKFLHFYFNEVFGIDISEDDYTIDLVGANSRIIHVTTLQSFYPVIQTNQFLNISFISSYNTLIISMKQSYQSSRRNGIFYINYYTDAAHTNLLTQLNIKYNFTPASTNPYD